MTNSFRLFLLLLLAAALAGCGEESSAEPPRLDPAVAERLAGQSEAIADALDSDDTCATAAAASKLRASSGQRQVPPSIRREIRRIVDLKAPGRICDGTPPPLTTTDDDEDKDEDDDRKGKKKDKKDKKHGHDDEDEEEDDD